MGQAMKIGACVLAFSVFFLLPAFSYPSTFGSLRISLIQGDVQIRTEDTGDWVPASINMPLGDGDRIWVPEGGNTELQLRDGSYLRLGENSALEILAMEGDAYQFYLTEGHSYASFRGKGDSVLQMDTPVSSVRAYDKALFRIDVTPEGYTDISVYRGSVDAEGRDGATRVDAGKTLSLREGNYAEISPIGPPDEWGQWNQERDRRLTTRRPPARYLPAELHPYANDFEENGRWVYSRGYGYVWTPTVVVSVGWAPYRIGRWVWIRGDYVWLSYEPWGWAPYHYGRWAFITSIGWCWVPPVRGEVYWGPGFVGWVHTPTHVSWVPLAPREIYYGHGYYGPHSINIREKNITHVDIHNVVYKNINVRNSVTVIHRDTFVSGKHVEVEVKENPFRKEKISIGRPDIRPEKATAMPLIKEIPQARRPPETIREIKVDELRGKRHLVRKRSASVLRPDSPPKELQLKVKEGRPVARTTERPMGHEKAGGGVEGSREMRPSQRPSQEKTREPETQTKKAKGQGTRLEAPPDKGAGEKAREMRPSQRPSQEKAQEPETQTKKAKGQGTRLEAPPGQGGSAKSSVKLKEAEPAERVGIERLRGVKPAEKATEGPRDSGTSGKGAHRPGSGEKGVQKAKGFRAIERGAEKPSEVAPVGKGLEKIQEMKPHEKGDQRPKEPKETEEEEKEGKEGKEGEVILH